MGKLSRRKGGNFERKVIKIMRPYFPEAAIRRTRQSEQALDSDVILEGKVHQILRDIWWECTSAENPSVQRKYNQATRDTERSFKRTGRIRIPVVIWHKKRTPKIWAELSLGHLLILINKTETALDLKPIACNALIRMEFQEFLAMLKEYTESIS